MEHSINRRGLYSTAFEQEVAIEALKGSKTIQQIALDYKISPDVVKVWLFCNNCGMSNGRKKRKRRKISRKSRKTLNMEEKVGVLRQNSRVNDGMRRASLPELW